MTRNIDEYADVIDVRDLIERYEEIEESTDGDEAEERADIEAILEELKGNGGDEKWRGDWYPLTLIRDSYFTDYAQGLAEEIGAVNAGAQWPNNCIDWEQAARELRMDYNAVDFRGGTFWYR